MSMALDASRTRLPIAEERVHHARNIRLFGLPRTTIMDNVQLSSISELTGSQKFALKKGA